jgi:biofilm PGA synthesis N-glycosyltransferase PgaC
LSKLSEKMIKPFISIIVPAFNEEKRIATCLESLANLNYPKDSYEVILVNNGSTDKTEEVAQGFGVRVLNFTGLQGVSAARQAGAEAAKGEIIAYTDSDSSVSKDWLDALVEILVDPSIVAVGGRVLPLRADFIRNFLYDLYHWFLIANQAIGRVLPWGSNLSIKKQALEEIGGFTVELTTSEDWDISLRLQKRFGKKAVVYKSEPKVFASTRKQDNLGIFLRYFLDGVPGYLLVLLFGKIKSAKMMVVR